MSLLEHPIIAGIIVAVLVSLGGFSLFSSCYKLAKGDDGLH